MGFTVGTEREALQEHTVRGRYQKVAVGCWFTSTGKGMPQIVKYEDADGCLEVLRDIQILKSEQKYYGGILRRKYECEAMVNGVCRRFILLYNPETNSWDMVV